MFTSFSPHHTENVTKILSLLYVVATRMKKADCRYFHRFKPVQALDISLQVSSDVQ